MRLPSAFAVLLAGMLLGPLCAPPAAAAEPEQAATASAAASATFRDSTFKRAKRVARTGVAVPRPRAAPVAQRWHLTAAFQQEQPASQHGGSITDAQAAAQARSFDLLTVLSRSESGQTATSPPHRIVPLYTPANIQAMRAANPRFRIGHYLNGGTSANPNHPESWYAHDAAGSRAVNTDFGTRYVMQPDNAQWQAYLRGYALNLHRSSDYDDIFVDVLGDYPLRFDPVKPGTRTRYTSAAWYGMTKEVAATLQNALPAGSRVIANGLAHGGKYPTSKALLSGAAAGMAEIFTRTPDAPFTSPSTGRDVPAESVSAWQAELRMVEDLNVTDKVGVLLVKDWTRDAAAEDRLKYGFATAMLATDGSQYVGVSLGQPTTMDTYTWLSGTDYGAPQGPYTVNGDGLHQRVFAKATIAVNPTDTPWSGEVRGRLVTVPSRRAAFVVDGG